MKPQDIVFLLILLALIFLRKPRIIAIAGLLCLVMSIPLFQFQIFFTAQRLVMYAVGLIFVAILFMLYDLRRDK